MVKSNLKDIEDSGCSYVEGRGIAMEIISGKPFYPLGAKESEIYIKDIAHALSNICRYNGHCNTFYSVAQHCVILSYLLKGDDKFTALMHDATEAYLGDMIRPLKLIDDSFNKNEDNLWKVIARRFVLPNSLSETLKYEDTRICFTERRDLLNHTGECSWGKEMLPHEFKINTWPPKKAKRIFLRRFNELCSHEDKIQLSGEWFWKPYDSIFSENYDV